MTTEGKQSVTPRRRGRPPGRRSENYEVRRDHVINTAARLFAKQGYSGTSMNDLMDATGMGKGGIYNYIDSKEQLLVDIAARVMEPLNRQAAQIAELDESPLVRLRLISEAILVNLMERTDDVWVYEHDYRYLTGANRALFLKQRHALENLVTGIAQEAADQQLFRVEDLPLLLIQYFSLHKQTVQWIGSHSWTATEISRSYCRTLFNGFALTADDFDDVEQAVSKYVAAPTPM